jgi:hypothetical protein
VVVRGGGEHRVRVIRRPLRHAAAEGARAAGEMIGVEADIVARKQPAVSVEGGVLHRLGSDRGGELLETPDRVAAQVDIARSCARQPVADAADDRRVSATRRNAFATWSSWPAKVRPRISSRAASSSGAKSAERPEMSCHSAPSACAEAGSWISAATSFMKS